MDYAELMIEIGLNPATGAMMPYFKFDDSQPRDENGRWTATGDSSFEPHAGRAKTTDEWTKRLSSKEVSAIDDWSYGRDQAFRKLDAGVVTEFDDQTEKEIAASLQNFRNALNKAPLYEGVVYRGLALENRAALDKFTVGAKVTHNAISSWSRESTTAEGFMTGSRHGVRLEVKTTRGVDISSMSRSPKEQEVVLGKGKMRVVKVETLTGQTDNYKRVVVEEL